MIKNLDDLYISDWSLRTCTCCWKRANVRIGKRTEIIKFREEDLEFEADTYFGICPQCGAEVYVPELNGLNLAIRNMEFKIARNS